MKEQERAADHLEGYAEILAGICATGRGLTREERESLRSRGERAAERGLGLRALVRDLLSAAQEVRAGLRRTEAEHLLAAVEQAVDAFAEGHERAQRLAVRQEEAARREFIDDLLHGGSGPGRIAERAEHFGLLLSHAHAVAVAQGAEPYGDGYEVTRRVESSLLARFGNRRILLTTKDGRLICVAPSDEPEVLTHFAKQAYAATDGGQVAVGRPHPGPGGVVHSYEEALNALDLAARMELDAPVLYAADLLVYPVLTRDRQAMADLVRTVLGPLQGARGGARPLLDTLTAYFDTGCVSAQAARQLSLSVRAMTYRLDRIYRLTGADPADPVQRYTLQTAVIGARLLDWPDQPL
ncbi:MULTISPECIES: PucR family transcriptional regulator [unclassified Streptomyces]|uniref:PucR family transcriptional regulator n=1 Tax=unclassified Streptomyces TaxID=2593676 RepID=UPI001D9BE347|nr:MULTISPECIES: helix-turn-helix domain-containing protein [unclassified Streptomyces]MBD0708266.1 regulator [Streptomyces sp. CBMA291]MBD0716505.1 regulator [Streptomyces sp. CBMA370]